MDDIPSAQDFHQRTLTAMAAIESPRVQSTVLETAGVIAGRMHEPAQAVILISAGARLQGRELTDVGQAALDEARQLVPSSELGMVLETASRMSIPEAFDLALHLAALRGAAQD
jgi:hypothetical protein